MYKWSCTVKTCVVQGSTTDTCTVLQIKRNAWKPVYQAHLLRVNKGIFFYKIEVIDLKA